MIVTIITKTYDGKPKYETILREVNPYVDIFKSDIPAAPRAAIGAGSDAGHVKSGGTVTKFSPARV